MADNVTIGKVKTDLRISNTHLDESIKDEIDACVQDLKICGVPTPKETDPAILSAIKLWCRRWHSDDPVKMQRYGDAYDALKGTLQVAEGYGGAAANG